MITLLLALALLQDSDKEIAGHVARLPNDDASAALIKIGAKAVPPLLAAFAKETSWTDRKVALETALWRIRGFRVARGWTPNLLQDQEVAASFAVRSKDEADKHLQGLDKAFPNLDWDKEMIIVLLPEQKLQVLTMDSLTEDAKAKTLTIAYGVEQRVGCGNTSKCETGVVIAVPKSDAKIVYAPRMQGLVRPK